MTARLTEAQKVLARQALGLGIAWTHATRNKAYAVGAAQWGAWDQMVADGFAEFVPGHDSFSSYFRLTRAGADRALDVGDTLEPTLFPPIGAH